jgi:hypothetical protein
MSAEQQGLLSTVLDDDMATAPVMADCAAHGPDCSADVLVWHRVIPLSWTRWLGQAASRQEPLCPNAHLSLHRLLVNYAADESWQPYDTRLDPLLLAALDYWDDNEPVLRRMPGADLIRRYPDDVDEEPLQRPWWSRLLGMRAW